MGYRKTTDFIEKATWSLAIVICVLSICCSFAVKAPKASSSAIVNEKSAPLPPPLPVPTQPGSSPAARAPELTDGEKINKDPGSRWESGFLCVCVVRFAAAVPRTAYRL